MNTAAREQLIRRNIDAWNSPDWEAELGRLWIAGVAFFQDGDAAMAAAAE